MPGYGHKIALGGAFRATPEWTPPNALPLVWFDVSAVGGVTLSGSDVVSLNDLSGNVHHATDGGVSTRRPAYQATGLNSKPTITSDGATDYLLTNNIDLSALTALSWALVCKDTETGNKFVFECGNIATSSGAALLVNNGADLIEFYGKGATSSLRGVGGTAGTGATDLATAAILMGTYDTALDSTHEQVLYQNGVDVSSPLTAGDTTGSLGNLPLALFASHAGAALWAGSMSEFILAPGAWTTAQRANVNRYLKAKWGTP